MSNESSTHQKPHHTDKGFRNLYGGSGGKSLWSVFKMRWGSEWAKHSRSAHLVPRVPVDLERIHSCTDACLLTWLGHSTYLIQLAGVNILTDPVFSERASPVRYAGPKRYTAPAISIKDLPTIHIVLISHNHYDHMDLATAQKLGNKPLWIVPLKNARHLEGVGITNVVELDWWASHQVSGLRITATPAQHWSARGIFDQFDSLWSGFAVQSKNQSIFFAGDTGYNEHQFKEIGARLGPFTASLIPIGAYEPRWFMKAMHVNPTEAVAIHQDVGSRQSLAIHWGTFPLTAEAPEDPPRLLTEALTAANLPTECFQAVPIGYTTELEAPPPLRNNE